MIFNPQNIVKAEGSFVFSGAVKATANHCLNKDIIKEFWHNFTFHSSTLEINVTNEFIFSVGDVKPYLLDGADYSINIEKNGFCVFAENEKNLLCGLMTLFDRLKAVDKDEELAVEIENCQIRESALIKNRMVHFCIFPETELWELQRFVRFCGALKYTHIVLEFWGMLKYDCLKELSWPQAFSKDQIRPIIQEANDLGLEVVPMFNHWGHASSGRVMHGKHVVLDQNPMLQTYFSQEGWCWDIRKPKVRELMCKIRAELVELCGNGRYFHIGCDEAYNFDFSKESMDHFCDYINEISDELKLVNRKAIMWGDMFLYRHSHYSEANKNRYTCNAPSAEIEEYLLKSLKRDVIIADWQYSTAKAPVETASVFTQKGFECLLCPWDCGKAPLNAALTTAKTQNISGIIHTTWHTLSSGTLYVTAASIGCYEEIGDRSECELLTVSASLNRKVMNVNGDYVKAGWSKFQVSNKW